MELVISCFMKHKTRDLQIGILCLQRSEDFGIMF